MLNHSKGIELNTASHIIINFVYVHTVFELKLIKETFFWKPLSEQQEVNKLSKLSRMHLDKNSAPTIKHKRLYYCD